MNKEVRKQFALLLKNLANLIKIKSLITLCVIAVFMYMAISDKLQPSEVMVIVTAIITYFFSKDMGSKKED